MNTTLSRMRIPELQTKLADAKRRLAEIQKDPDFAKRFAEAKSALDTAESTQVEAGDARQEIWDTIYKEHGFPKKSTSKLFGKWAAHSIPTKILEAIEKATGVKWNETVGLWGNRNDRYDPYSEFAGEFVRKLITDDPRYKAADKAYIKALEARNRASSAYHATRQPLDAIENEIRGLEYVIEEKQRKTRKVLDEEQRATEEEKRTKRAKVQALLDGEIKIEI